MVLGRCGLRASWYYSSCDLRSYIAAKTTVTINDDDYRRAAIDDRRSTINGDNDDD